MKNKVRFIVHSMCKIKIRKTQCPQVIKAQSSLDSISHYDPQLVNSESTESSLTLTQHYSGGTLTVES